MAETRLMRADEIVNGFNGATDRKYWRAAAAGTRVNPEVHFNSRATMVRIVYRVATDDFTVTFAKTSAAFGDFMASVWRSMEQVTASLKAAGLPIACIVDDRIATLRIEYDPRSKVPTVTLANLGDDWPNAQPMPLKVPERNISENSLSGVDAP